MKKLTTEDFIQKAKKYHGEKYDYSKVIYNKCGEKICITCKTHGDFWMTPDNHSSKSNHHGCPKCNGGIKITLNDFIMKAKEIHGEKYDYSKVIYINHSTKICILCFKHGEFFQTPNSHISAKSGCPKCNWIGGINLIHFKRKPEIKNKPAILYFVKLGDECKIGITTRTVKSRFYGMNFEPLKVIKLPLFKAFKKEQNILKKFEHYRITSSNIKKSGIRRGGSTECFNWNNRIQNKIIKEMLN